MNPVDRSALALPWAHVLAGFLAVAVALNLLEFPIVESRAVSNWKSLGRWERSDLQEAKSVRLRYGMFVELANIAPGATIIIAKRGHLPHRDSFRQRLFGLGRVKATIVRDFNPFDEMDFEGGEGSVSITGHLEKLEFTIVVAEPGNKEFVFLMPGRENILFLDTALLSSEQLEALVE